MSMWDNTDSSWESEWQDPEYPSNRSSASNRFLLIMLGLLIGGLGTVLVIWLLFRSPRAQPVLLGFFVGDSRVNLDSASVSPTATPVGAFLYGIGVITDPEQTSMAMVVTPIPKLVTPTPELSIISPTTTSDTKLTPQLEQHMTPAFTPTSNHDLEATPISSSVPAGSAYLPDVPALQRLMLNAINRDRSVAGLSPMQWDPTAELSGQLHAADMLTNGYFSHWNLDGLGPEHRYSLVGGTDAVFENLYTYSYRYSDGRAAPVSNWEDVISEAQQSLMDSPGHRRNILDPFHTHVGIGIVYDADLGEMRLAQEFVNHWSSIDQLPNEMITSDSIVFQGVLSQGADKPLLNLAYQPFPTTFSFDTVPITTYQSEAEIVSVVSLPVKGKKFSTNVDLPEARRPGVYLFRLWVEILGQSVLVSEQAVWARE